jgi:lycopene beta-cyclase
MKKYDYIITGSGASGLILLYRMMQDPFFARKSILLIDKEEKNTNDRTWCYWEKGVGEWDDILEKSWDDIVFASDVFSDKLSIGPYTYKMIRSSKLYEKIQAEIPKHKNITVLKDEVLNISHRSDSASVLAKTSDFPAKKVINSIMFDKPYKHQEKYPVLRQHFLGWFIEVQEDTFDDSAATFMDFTVEQRKNTRFMYILPLSPRVALFEYTLFSPKLLPKEEYEYEIEEYLEERGITDYKIIEKEQGVIPMTSYRFWKHNSKNVLNIGTVGGWSKASTGYTFMNITKKTKDLVEYLKTGESLRDFHKATKFWWYDLLLLDVLAKDNSIGAKIFGTLFKKNSVQNIFKFLDEETSFGEDLRVMLTMPPWRFVKALFKRVFSKSSK